jgi:hypothetical protein
MLDSGCTQHMTSDSRMFIQSSQMIVMVCKVSHLVIITKARLRGLANCYIK